MHIFKSIFSFIWRIYFLLVIALVVLILYPITYILLTNEKYFHIGFPFVRFQAKMVLFLSGFWRKVEFKAELPPPPFVICPNHTSYLDIFLTYAIFSDYFIFMGKKELGSVPVFNIYFKQMNILVDRANVKSAHKAFLRAGDEIKKGYGIVVFPEGTIPKTIPQMKAFKNGAFRLAVENQVPIVPVTFKNNYLLMEDSMKFGAKARPGLAKVTVHKAIETKGLSEADLVNLRMKVRNIIESEL